MCSRLSAPLCMIATLLHLVSAIDIQSCVHSNTTNSITDCTVHYNQSISLICPKKGFWLKDSSTIGVQESTTLTLPIESIGQDRISFINNNGLYTCHHTEQQLYPFNVTVLGPPEFISNSTHHVYVPDSAAYSVVTTSDEMEYGTLVVQVVGNGGLFTVKWSTSDVEDACGMEHVVCSEEKINETSMTFTFKIPTHFYKASLSKNYRSTVTSRYGSSSATTYLEYQCSKPGYDPVRFLPKDEPYSVTFKNGSLLSLPCVATMKYINDYGMCYGIGNDTFHSVFNTSGRCAACTKGESCYTNLTGITASVDRYHSIECNRYGIVLNITEMALTQDLTFYCFWYSNDREWGSFAEYVVSIDDPSSHVRLRAVLGGIFTGTLLLVVIVIVIISAMCIVRRRRSESIKIDGDPETTPIINILETDGPSTITTEVQTIPYSGDEDGHEVLSTGVLYYGSFMSLNTTSYDIELPSDPNSIPKRV